MELKDTKWKTIKNIIQDELKPSKCDRCGKRAYYAQGYETKEGWKRYRVFCKKCAKLVGAIK